MNGVRASCPAMDLIKISQLRKERFDMIEFDAGIGLSDAAISWGMIEVPELWEPSAENCVLIPGEIRAVSDVDREVLSCPNSNGEEMSKWGKSSQRPHPMLPVAQEAWKCAVVSFAPKVMEKD